VLMLHSGFFWESVIPSVLVSAIVASRVVKDWGRFIGSWHFSCRLFGGVYGIFPFDWKSVHCS